MGFCNRRLENFFKALFKNDERIRFAQYSVQGGPMIDLIFRTCLRGQTPQKSKIILCQGSIL